MNLAAALVGAVFISLSAIFFGLSEVDPVTAAFYRFAYALPVLFVLWWFRRGEDQRTSQRRWLAVASGVALGIDVVLWHMAIEQIGTGLATLIANAQVIFVAIAGWLVLKERPNRLVLVAIPIVLFGVALVSGIGQESAYGANPALGTLMALIAAVFYAAFLLAFRASNHIAAPTAGPLVEATAGGMITILVLSLLGPGIDFSPVWPGHGWLLALALGAQVGAWLLVGYALPRLPAVETATIILIQPAMTIIWGAIIFDERPSNMQWVGVVVVLAGVGLVAIARTMATRPALSTT